MKRRWLTVTLRTAAQRRAGGTGRARRVASASTSSVVAVLGGLWRVAADANGGIRRRLQRRRAHLVHRDVRGGHGLAEHPASSRTSATTSAPAPSPSSCSGRRRCSACAWRPRSAGPAAARRVHRRRQRSSRRSPPAGHPDPAALALAVPSLVLAITVQHRRAARRSRRARSGSATPARPGSSTRSSCSSSAACSSRSRCCPGWL